MPTDKCQHHQALCACHLRMERVLFPGPPNTQLSARHRDLPSQHWLNGRMSGCEWATCPGAQTVGSGRTFWKPLSPMCKYDLLKAHGKTGRRPDQNPRSVALPKASCPAYSLSVHRSHIVPDPTSCQVLLPSTPSSGFRGF